MATQFQTQILTLSENESSMDTVTRDGALVSVIVRHLTSVFDLHSASLVCKLWNDAVTWETRSLTIRSRRLLPLFTDRFSHVKALNFRQCFDQVENEDLLMAASAFRHLTDLMIGHPERPQEKVTDDGLLASVKNWNLHNLNFCCVSGLRDAGIHALMQNCPNLTSFSLTSCRNLTDGALDALANCKSLMEIQLTGIFMFTASGLAKIGENCKGLVRVCLEFESLDITLGLKSLSLNCQNLETLTLKFRDGDIGELSRCRNLIILHIEADNRNNVDRPIMNIAVNNGKLRKFTYFNRSSPLGEDAVKALMYNCKNLEKICVEATALSDSAVWGLVECKCLNSFALHNFCKEGKSLVEIARSRMKLKSISLAFGRGIWDGNLETLIRANGGLERINLQCCLGPSYRAFSAIAGCTNLQKLDLSFTDVDDASLSIIANNAINVRHLSLMKCESITDMKILSKFRALEYLNLDQCLFVNDEGLDYLTVGCSRLTDLSLASTRITDSGLSYLVNCSFLRSLKIPYCRGVRGPGLVAIVKCCRWLQYLVISHRLRDSEALVELRKQNCMVRLDVDDLALVPFGFYALM